MDPRQFDRLARSLGRGVSRRTALKGLLGIGGSASVAVLASNSGDSRRSTGPRSTTTPSPCPPDTQPCDTNSTGCCAICEGNRPITCGYDCCSSPEQCCGNQCCPDGAVCIGEERCCPGELACHDECCFLPGQCRDGSCVSPSPTPSNTAASNPSETPTQIPTQIPTDTATNTPTLTSTSSPTNTPTQIPTQTPTNTATNTPTQTPTSSPTNTPTQSPTNAATNTPTQTPTSSPTNTATQSPTNTATNTPTQTPTSSPTNTATQTPTSTNTASNTPTQTATNTPTETPTSTPTGTVGPCIADLDSSTPCSANEDCCNNICQQGLCLPQSISVICTPEDDFCSTGNISICGTGCICASLDDGYPVCVSIDGYSCANDCSQCQQWEVCVATSGPANCCGASDVACASLCPGVIPPTPTPTNTPTKTPVPTETPSPTATPIISDGTCSAGIGSCNEIVQCGPDYCWCLPKVSSNEVVCVDATTGDCGQCHSDADCVPGQYCVDFTGCDVCLFPFEDPYRCSWECSDPYTPTVVPPTNTPTPVPICPPGANSCVELVECGDNCACVQTAQGETECINFAGIISCGECNVDSDCPGDELCINYDGCGPCPNGAYACYPPCENPVRPSPNLTPTNTPTASPTSTATNSPTETSTNTPTDTATPTQTPSATASSTLTNTAVPCISDFDPTRRCSADAECCSNLCQQGLCLPQSIIGACTAEDDFCATGVPVFCNIACACATLTDGDPVCAEISGTTCVDDCSQCASGEVCLSGCCGESQVGCAKPCSENIFPTPTPTPPIDCGECGEWDYTAESCDYKSLNRTSCTKCPDRFDLGCYCSNGVCRPKCPHECTDYSADKNTCETWEYDGVWCGECEPFGYDCYCNKGYCINPD